MISLPLTMMAPCVFGLESVLRYEIQKIGGENLQIHDGRIYFQGDWQTLANANLWLRTAERVGVVVGMFEARTFTELFDQTALLPWEEWLSEDAAFPVKGASVQSQLASLPDCQKIIKRAIVRRLEGVYHREWFSETGLSYQIQFFFHKDKVTLLIDASGAGLHKRGYRQNAGGAPLKETLAAGLVDLARVRSDSVVVDPLCGSGTILIEAALKALNIAPGLRRRFACQSWPQMSGEIFTKARQEALAAVNREGCFLGYGSDIDPEMVRLTRENAAKAGVAARIKVSQKDAADFVLPQTMEKAVVMTNPPYGERLLDAEQAREICRTLGAVFVPGPGRSFYILSPQGDFEELFGRSANRRRKLYNGMISCQVYMYF